MTGLADLTSTGLDLADHKRKSAVEDGPTTKKKLPYIFRPIDQVQQTTDRAKVLREHGRNLEPVKRDDRLTEINLRTFVCMDNEPMYLLQALQGSLVVATNDYLTRDPQTYSD